MQSSPGDLWSSGEWSSSSGEWSLGIRVCREVTCVRGLSKHPGPFHRDVAFSTGADLTEFDCREASKLRESSTLSPFSQYHPAN